MSTKKVNRKVAIIGLGKIGQALAGNLTRGGQPVILASRDLTKAALLAAKLGPLASSGEIAWAIHEAEIIIPAIGFDLIKEFLHVYSQELAGKTIVDVSNAIAPSEEGGFKKTIAEGTSAGQILSELVPATATLVKAFGTLGAGSVINSAFSQPERKVLFYATDSRVAGEVIEELIQSSGFEALGIGGLDQSARIEVFGDLHEFGALGKTVTLNEALVAKEIHAAA
jgi:predicted dinucleotide-binding enzyme